MGEGWMDGWMDDRPHTVRDDRGERWPIYIYISLREICETLRSRSICIYTYIYIIVSYGNLVHTHN